MSETGFLASEYPPAAPDKAGFYVIPCPLERSVSYGGGTKFGPEEIIKASQELEKQENGLTPGEKGIYTMPPINCDGPAETVLTRIEAAVEKALAHNAIPVLLGGEHTATLGALRALRYYFDKKGEKFGVVQFDAHADLRDQYKGDPLSHASVMARAVHDLELPLVQFAVREISPEEIEVREIENITHYDAYFLARVGLPEKPLPEDFPRDIYITFDLDALDSGLMPATGTPSPGGLNWRETHFILETIARTHKIRGFDVMELAPLPGLIHPNFAAAKLVHLLMGLAAEKNE
ncbi:MAG: agmatinase [Desulfovibrio sp.]|nr:agmatinase [Desulfovibrio sp.]